MENRLMADLPTNYTNSTPSTDQHPDAHNATNAAVNALRNVQAWQTPTLTAPFTNFDTVTFNGAGYYKDPSGIVRLRGMIAPNAAPVGSKIFSLPAGLWPAKRELLCGIADSNNTVDVRVYANGDVYRWASAGTTWFSLDGLTFRAV
jgi:hypothetical protein